jgi:hypothetical protein
MIQLEDIHSLSNFQRSTKEHLLRLKETGKPAVLTVNGSLNNAREQFAPLP